MPAGVPLTWTTFLLFRCSKLPPLPLRCLLQVARLLESLNIDPRQLPATANEASWERIFQQQGGAGAQQPMLATDVAAGAAMVSEGLGGASAF